ncbi:MAG: hypothetical protein M3Y59_15675 [Myxococcota bacterium]|nr:hypothetical protein [Myxococcota bacterium]
MRLPALLLCTTLMSACTHTPVRTESDVQEVKSTADAFHRRTRWKDFQSASSLIVPERRAAFLAARDAQRDERDLSISDYELLEMRVEADGSRAEVVSRISWFRMPNLSEHSDTVITELVPVGTTWLIARQSRGPFTPEMQDPYVPTEPASPPVP